MHVGVSVGASNSSAGGEVGCGLITMLESGGKQSTLGAATVTDESMEGKEKKKEACTSAGLEEILEGKRGEDEYIRKLKDQAQIGSAWCMESCTWTLGRSGPVCGLEPIS